MPTDAEDVGRADGGRAGSRGDPGPAPGAGDPANAGSSGPESSGLRDIPGARDAEHRATPDPDTAARLGAQIRALRKARGLTLARVASATGLSHPFLSQVERGIHQPSLGSLRRIAVALETSPIELIAAADPPAARGVRVEVLRAGEGAVPEGFSSGTARMLAHGARGFHPLEVDVSRADPGELFVHAEGEFLYALSGAVRVELDGVVHALAPGDSTFYAGGVAHRWWTLDDAPARLLVVKETVRR
ncbi:XRE family transcriptional regulator [Microbacterium betulae]|uniref:XRE family transcriptional regulator n=1 Tax=Microbacterium betulae TaxID=2981139 RepID=A0AA97FFZ4_9MICO|nr:XRE family transcriptional regulator [Microbacterium sp. AB]WOF22751.1 XRE family transcriptional regulator [Microbacterium sp. AB]